MSSDSITKKVIFILGGARSGKSHFAQELAKKMGEKVLFVATAEALDEEMKTRIEEHKKARPRHWRTLELPETVARGIEAQIEDAQVVILDCLTLLVSNLLNRETDYSRAEKQVIDEINGLISCSNRLSVIFIIVSNEVGMGIVPENELSRYYRDLLGKVNQLVSQQANEVYLMVAGIPLKVKG